MSPSSLLSRLNLFPGKRGAKNSEKSKKEKEGDPQQGAVASSTLSATSSRSIVGTSTAHTQFYTYEPLLGASAFRLLKLEPGEKDDPVVIRLRTDDIEAQPVYDALSYVWGDPTRNEHILCEGKALKITASLLIALKRLRHRSEKITLWADSICINQSDLDECSRQVKIMGSIYKSSKTVRIWLGEDNRNARTAFSSIRHIYHNVGESEAMGIIPDAVWEMFSLPWFFRVWVIQEASFGTNCITMWGDEEIDFLTLSVTAQFLSQRVPPDMSRVPLLGLRHAAFIGRYFSLAHCAPMVQGVTEPGSYCAFLTREHTDQMQGNLHAFLQILKRARSFHATDPKDKVFAILGHPSARLPVEAGNGLIVEPDYRKSLEDIFRELTKKWIEATKSLDILSAVQHCDVIGASKYISTAKPSWIAEWHNYYGFDCLPGSNYRAGYCGTEALFEISRDRIRVYGFVCGTIQQYSTMFNVTDFYWTGDSPNEADPVFFITKNFLPHIIAPNVGLCPPGDSVASALSLTLTAGRVPLDISEQAQTEIAEEKGISLAGVLEDDQLVDLARIRQLQTNFIAYQSRQLEARGNRTANTEKYRNYPGANTFDFRQMAMEACHGKRYFMTGEKYIGLGPEIMEVGDLVCVVLGAKTPFLLRRNNENYQLVGECYLYGFMEGQAIRMEGIGALEVQEFVLI